MSIINLETVFKWRNSDQLVSKMQEHCVIPKDGEIKCPVHYCNGHFKMWIDAGRVDGVRWACDGMIRYPKAKTVKCKRRASIRYKTFFHNSKLPLWKIVGFCRLWVRKCQLTFIMEEMSMASHTAVDWASFCREVVFDAFITNAKKIGGPGKIVEIDESKFGMRKFHRGHHVEGAWVFGGFERDSGRVFMVVVEDRTAETLLDCIERFIEPGTTIYCWKGYSGLKGNPKYEHMQVNHSLHFKDPETGVHTNAIESSWRHAKASGPYANRQKGFLGGYLARYMFLKKVKEVNEDPLAMFFTLARGLYDPSVEPPEFEIETEGDEDDEEDFDFEFN